MSQRESYHHLDPSVEKIDPLSRQVIQEFTEDSELFDLFGNELERLISQSNHFHGWNPHWKLEFIKMSIRTAAAHLGGIYKNKFNKQLSDSQAKLDALHKQLDETNDNHISIEKNTNDELMERQGKYIANRARLNWKEKGEKYNKYFMNLIKSNNSKQSINELIFDGISTRDQQWHLVGNPTRG